MATINVFTEGVRFPYRKLKKKDIEEMLVRACRSLRLGKAVITVIATDNGYIREINRKYRKKNKPTDVISFCQREGTFPQGGNERDYLGEIYLSLEKAEEQAAQYDVTFREEVCRLTLHGLLHLAGYDHEKSERERIAMESMESRLLERLK